MRRMLLVPLFVLLLPCMSLAQSDILTINGYSSFEFEKMFGDEGQGDPNGSFDVDLFDIVVNFRPHDSVRVAADLTWEHGAASEDGRGNVAVEYAFAEYYANDWFQVRAGKMFTAFGIYNEIHTAKPAFLTVKEPLSTNKNNKFGSELRFYPRWGAGLALVGNGVVLGKDLDYILQLTNGEQEFTNPYEEDDNTQKAFGGRIRYRFATSLTAAASFYADKLSEPTEEVEVGSGRTDLFSYGGHLAWEPEPFGLEVEYVRGSVAPSFTDKVTRHAWTAMIYYSIKGRVTPYLRYEYLDPDTNRADDSARQLIYGLNFHVASRMFLKAELNTVDSDEANSRFEGQGYTEFKSAVVVGF